MSMYNPANTLEVTQEAIAQLIGKGYMEKDYTLDALSDDAIVDLGEVINPDGNGDFQLGSPADIVFKAFVSRLAKINVDTRAYVASLPKLYVDPINWGLMVEEVMVDLSDCMVDEMWNPAGYIPYNTAPDPLTPTVYPGVEEGKRIAAIEFGFYRPAISVKLFKKMKAVMCALTTMRDQLFTAFTSVDELNRFLAGLYNSIDNTLQVKAEIYAKMTISTAIGRAFVNGNGIDLRAAAVAAGLNVSTTPTEELMTVNEDFQSFALQKIAETQQYIKDYTALFNNGDMATFASQPNAAILTKFAMSAKFHVRANTYNEKLLGIGEYDMVNMWQAATTTDDSTPYNLSAAGSIDFSKSAAIDIGLLPSGTEETHYELNNVIGVIYDRRAAGITIDKKKTTTQYAASRDTVNTFFHAAVNYVVNDNYPIVAFYISDPTEEEPGEDDGE